MKKFFYIAIVLILMALCGTANAKSKGFVRIDGENLIAPNGNKLFIQGTNLGNWLNPEGYMFGFGKTSSPRLINQMLCEMVGPDFTAEFWKKFKDNYVTKEDIAFLHSCGCNTIRIPFNYRLFTDEDYMGLTSSQDGFARIDAVVDWCREFGMYVVLDMHDAPGGQTGDNIDDSYGYPWLMESPASQALFYDIWTRIAKHYSNEPVVLGYELCNEPIAPYFANKDALNACLQPLYKKAVAAIRKVDNHHIVLLGAPQWNTNFAPLTDWKFDDKIMYTCHRYGGEPTADAIKDYISFRDKTGLPMYMGEIGHGTFEWQAAYCKVLKDNNIGYTFWPYKKIEKECMAAIKVPENWDIVVKFAEGDRNGFGKIRENRPDQVVARKAMSDFLEMCKFSNCTPVTGYINSMMLNNN